MATIKILTIGKTKESWLEAALAEYFKRLGPHFKVEIELARNDEDLLKKIPKHAIGLDPKGKLRSSEEFSSYIWKELEKGTLTLVIGGADGLPKSARESLPLISLSPLTFTHQMTRLILVEQLYRAAAIRQGSPYHR